jgi:hypothetical protein
VTSADVRLQQLQRLRVTWPDPKRKGTLADPYPHLSGWCNPAYALDHPGHKRCNGYGPESPSRGVLGCICPCHLAGVIMCGDATDGDLAVVRSFAAAVRNNLVPEYAESCMETYAEGSPQDKHDNSLLLHGDVATVSYGYGTAAGVDGATAEVIITGDRWVWEADAAAEIMLQEDGGCPICSEEWPVHMFLDDGRVACP